MPYVKPVIDGSKLLVVTVGLPRAGKSTWARTQRAPIVNRDSVRLALHGERFLSQAEGIVKELAVLQVRSLFLAGHYTVIVDETCTTRARREFWKFAGRWTTKYYPLSTTVAECLERAIDDPDIQPVIQRMFDMFEPLGEDEVVYLDPYKEHPNEYVEKAKKL